MSWDSFADSILALPQWFKWTIASLGVLLGIPMILWPERIQRGIRRFWLRQLRLIRKPGYRLFAKVYGWLLFVCGALLMILLLCGV
ncbi:MAG TPA: hypothetical protein VFR52_04050 [Sphingomicrobium sp.]|nr:hypothetical protein [Sphingomicrobium sp.]